MGWYLASFLCFSLRCSSRLLADFSKRLSRVDRIFLKFPRQPLEIFYFIGHNFLSGSSSPHVVFVNALQLFHSPLVFPLLLSDLKQPKQNCIVPPLLSFPGPNISHFIAGHCSSKVLARWLNLSRLCSIFLVLYFYLFASRILRRICSSFSSFLFWAAAAFSFAACITFYNIVEYDSHEPSQ